MAGLSRAGADLMLVCMRSNMPNALVLSAKTDAELATMAVQHGLELPPHLAHLLPEPEPDPPWSPLQSPSAVLEDNSWLGPLVQKYSPQKAAGAATTNDGASDDADLMARPKLKPKRVKGASKRQQQKAAAAAAAESAAAAAAAEDGDEATGPPSTRRKAPKRLKGRSTASTGPPSQDPFQSMSPRHDAPASNRPKIRAPRRIRGKSNLPLLEAVAEEGEREEAPAEEPPKAHPPKVPMGVHTRSARERLAKGEESSDL